MYGKLLRTREPDQNLLKGLSSYGTSKTDSYVCAFSLLFCLYSYKHTKQEGKCKYNNYHVLRISFVINAISLPPSPSFSLSLSPLPPPVFFFFFFFYFLDTLSLDKRCEVMDITITYGCTKTYFYMSEIKNGFFVYSSNSIILFITVTMFHKLYIFFLNVVDAFFYVKHGFCYRLN